MEEIKNKKVLFVIGAIFLLILVIGGTFAYFQIVANNNATSTTISGEGELVGQVTLNTNITQLRLNLTESIMNKDNIGKVYYASETGEGIESSEVTEGNGRYTLATANVTESDVTFDCNYAYVLSATTTTPVEDSSDENLKVVITEANGRKTTYTLKQLLSGVTHTGKMKKVTYGVDQTLGIEAYIENTSETQNGLSGNEYTITITPKSGTEGFSCDTYKPYDIVKESNRTAIAPFMVANQSNIDGLWNSGLEGDGLRYVGSGAYNSATTPANFICFGTTSASECKANEDKYMYRIIGVFPDEQGNQHLKLRKFKSIISKSWHSDRAIDTNWGGSTLYTELNGEGFLGNTTYDYLQNATWSDKIVEWKWTAVNTLTNSNSGPDYYSGSTMTPANIYLHEMNRSTKTSEVGEWTYPTGKIGLIYASDYLLSLGDEALAMAGSTEDNSTKLVTGWMHLSNNGTPSSHDWTLARFGINTSAFFAWLVNNSGYIKNYNVTLPYNVSPVFYLTSNTTISGGMGTYSDPYIIG